MQTFRRRYGLLLEWVVMALMIVLAVEVTLGVVFRAAGRSLRPPARPATRPDPPA